VGRLSWQVIHEFSANAERMSRVARLTARQAVAFFVLWDPAPPNLETISRCWQWMDKVQVSFWDGLILAAAEQAGCAWLLSEDFPAGRKYGSVTVVNPFRQSPF
jgi:predicted nucleic acid-binding protein